MKRGLQPHPTKKGWFIVCTANVDKNKRVLRIETPGPERSALAFLTRLRAAKIEARRGYPQPLETLLAGTRCPLGKSKSKRVSYRFGELLDDYSASLLRRVADGEIEESYRKMFEYRKPIYKRWFGRRDAASISSDEIKDRLGSLMVKAKGDEPERPVKPATYNYWRTRLQAVWALAVEKNKASGNPVDKVPSKEVRNKIKRFLGDDSADNEEARIREVIQRRFPEHEAEVDLFVHTGIRSDEAWSLRKADVNREHGIPWILLRNTKNGEDRYVPLNPEALTAIDTLAKYDDGCGYVISSTKRSQARRCGRAKRYPTFWWRKVLKEAGITRRLRPHDLRHTAASRMLISGEPLAVISEFLGHKDPRSAQRYAHLSKSRVREAVQVLSAWKPKPEPSNENLPQPAGITAINTQSAGESDKESEYHDKLIKCAGCGREFVFSACEQAFFNPRGVKHDPTHCKECNRKAA